MVSARTARTAWWCCLLLIAVIAADALAQIPARTGERPARSKRASARRSKPLCSVAGSLDLQFIYDDNILRLSDGSIDGFTNGIEPYRYDIETTDDLIVSPRLSVTLGRKLLTTRETTLRFGYIRWQYGRNGIKNNESYSLRLRQPAVGRDFVEMSYSYAPGSYVKQLSDRAPFDPRSSTPLVWLPFKGKRNAFLLGYSRRVSDGITARLDGGRVLRFYNRPFLENDNWEWNVSGNLAVSISKAFKVAGTYTYSDANARALDAVGETIATSDDSDGSYERDLYEAELTWSPGRRLKRIASAGLMGQYQEYFFTSDKPYYDDPLHTGRKDRVYVIELTTDTKPIYGPVKLIAGWRFSQRKSSLPASVQAEDAEEKAYKDQRFWLGASYPISGVPW